MREGKGLVTGWNEKGYPFHNQIPRLNASLSQPRSRGFKSQDDQGRVSSLWIDLSFNPLHLNISMHIVLSDVKV